MPLKVKVGSQDGENTLHYVLQQESTHCFQPRRHTPRFINVGVLG